jgi:phospholipid-translocating P-type ATPase (flippase)
MSSADAIASLASGEYEIDLSLPDRDLTRYHACLRHDDQFWPISIQNILLRGASTHYTESVVGVSIRTGHDTKIMKNMKHPPAKLTQFDRNLNRILIILFVFEMILCWTATVVGVSLDDGHTFGVIKELYPGYGTSLMEYFCQYFVLFSYLFPISTTVTIEIVRLFHAIIISNDPKLFDEEFGQGSSRNSNVICQIGLVSHFLSDKTGTLTENMMELLKFACSGDIIDADEYLNQGKMNEEHRELIQAMAVCNTVIVHRKHDGNIEYNANSPDEAAFVKFAEKCGMKLTSRTMTSLTLNLDGNCNQTLEILAVLPFSSERKRQSIIVKDEHGQVTLYCKGADSEMSQRSIEFHLHETVTNLASQGLRTLVFAHRRILPDELEPWVAAFRKAEVSLVNRDELIFECAEQIEKNLIPLGCTGLEDRLQREVPETIDWLRRAGIKIWVLTGDKLETAIAIGRTSGLIQPDSEIIIISETEQQTVGSRFKIIEDELSNVHNPVLVVTSNAVDYAIQGFWPQFLAIADRCNGVILARLSPYMKAMVTEAVRSQDCMTMAIGDGANDVGMIQTAHVGIGVYGREGSHAALASDFAIPGFRFIRRMLMVHGHWTYRRFSTVAILMLFKNMIFAFDQLWFNIECLWSPTALYSSFLMPCYNLIFTSLPVFLFGFFEQDLPQEVLEKNPQLYKCEFDPMSTRNLCLFCILAIWQSLCAYYGMRLLRPDGTLILNGTLSYCSVVYLVVFQVMIWMNAFDIWTVIIFTVNIMVVFLVLAIYGMWINSEMVPVFHGALSSPDFWAGWIFSILVGLTPGYVVQFVHNALFPSEHRQFSLKNTGRVDNVCGNNEDHDDSSMDMVGQ